MHSGPENPTPLVDRKTKSFQRFPIPLRDELQQSLAHNTPITLREGTNELSVTVETLTVKEADTPNEILTFTGRTAEGKKVKGVAPQKIGSLHVEFET